MILNQLGKNILGSMDVTYSIVSSTDEVPEILLEFDSIMECSTTGSATVTKYPTERGIYRTEYKYKNPDTVRMTGIISAGGLTGFSSVIKRLGTWDRKSAIEQIRAKLRELVAQMQLVDIQTRNSGRRERMTLSEYEMNETYDNYGSLEISMMFTEVPALGEKKKPKLTSDDDTENMGITMTQALAVGAGLLVVGSVATGNIAALSK